jgi:hypothetical protein
MTNAAGWSPQRYACRHAHIDTLATDSKTLPLIKAFARARRWQDSVLINLS